MVLSKALRAATRGVSTSAGARMALPALTTAVPKPSMMSAIFGGSSSPAMPPMDQPVAGLSIPEPPAAPAAAPVTNITTLSNGAKIASEDTPVSSDSQLPMIARSDWTHKTPGGSAGRAGVDAGLPAIAASQNTRRYPRGSPTSASASSDPRSRLARARSPTIPSVPHPPSSMEQSPGQLPKYQNKNNR